MGIIYCYTNKLNNKKYIGQTNHPSQRKRSHQFNVRSGFKTKFYDAVRKYGWKNFLYEILETTENLNDAEIYWISHFNTLEEGYNHSEGGGGLTGHKRSFEAIVSQREKMKGVKNTEEHNKRISEGLKEYYKSNPHPWEGKKHSTKNREKLINSAKNWRESRSEEEWKQHKKKLSLSKNNRKEIELDGIKFTSQTDCIKYIKEQYGLSRNTAIDYLKKGKHPSTAKKFQK